MTARRAAWPGRQAEMFPSDQRFEHIISMTIDWTVGGSGDSVGTCRCSWQHREARDAPGYVGRMDDACARHWQSVGADQYGGR